MNRRFYHVSNLPYGTEFLIYIVQSYFLTIAVSNKEQLPRDWAKLRSFSILDNRFDRLTREEVGLKDFPLYINWPGLSYYYVDLLQGKITEEELFTRVIWIPCGATIE